MLTLKIVSPERVVFTGEVDSVLVPGAMGSFEILTGHAPIISTLEEGKVVYGIKGAKTELHIVGGFVEVQKNVVNLCIEI
ncbi:ATP synthase F1 subunit epsilon [Prevotella scopos JCM 17725]|jgi:ATP synthase F1, epsilon subunit|uniref:F-type H+-transporting ATPase subunit epsilon n=1 Tax=Prevotella scopos JCM 17725 TaxID=1236518 RepID=A0AAX2F6K5_9BACT|nr:ATP synthase F1 subunit epsilon [Prevotella scopos]ANR73722.1 ATP synthase F1 subunit epsilon [Prevotella scopos JCM 17725]QUB44308.1 ATP synthase F1 subunit epsilon [Prevotella scopos JCM 17725]SHG08639.1 F-type H+-transporting ATPase subunit epsilon [Prevotella scopos JCM 17725]